MNPTDDPPIDPVAEAFDLLTAAIAEANAQVGRLPDDHPPAALVALLGAFREQRQRLAAVESTVEARVARTLGTGKHRELGVHVHAGSKTTWLDPRTLGWRIIEPLILDRDTGEARVDPDRAADLLDRLFDCAHVDYFRVGTMADHGVQYDDLVKREPTRRTVQILSPAGDA